MYGLRSAVVVAIVDSQSVKTTEAAVSGTLPPTRWAANQVPCHRRRRSDRDALPALLEAVGRKSPWIELAFVDGGYAGDETNGPPSKRAGSGSAWLSAPTARSRG
jgi:hypothetical protein